MKELSQAQLLAKVVNEHDPFALFIYTPLCGTCKLAKRMLLILLEMSPSLPIYQANINLMPGLAKKWSIANVPCLLILEQRTIAQRHYALNSVDYLYRILKPLI